MNKTFEDYSKISEGLLLITKYNIMDAMEYRMGPKELKENREKYAKFVDFKYSNLKNSKIKQNNSSNPVNKWSPYEYLFRKLKYEKCEFQNEVKDHSNWTEEKRKSESHHNTLFIIGKLVIYLRLN